MLTSTPFNPKLYESWVMVMDELCCQFLIAGTVQSLLLIEPPLRLFWVELDIVG